MSTTLRSLPYSRFIRRASAGPAALVATPAMMDAALDALKAAPWRQTRDGLTVTMPASDAGITSAPDAWDAFKNSADGTLRSGVQSVILGMAAYRFRIPAAALAGSPASATALVRLYANKFTLYGLRVTALMSASAEPPTDWDTLRGDDGNPFAQPGRLPEPAANTSGARNNSETLELLPGGAACAAFLWVIVQPENWSNLLAEYWALGAGFLDAPSIIATFDRDGVTLDPTDYGFSFPVDPQDLYDPARMYPLDVAETRNRWFGLPDAVRPLIDPPDSIRKLAVSVAYPYAGDDTLFVIWIRNNGTVGYYAPPATVFNGTPITALDAISDAVDVACSHWGFIAARADGSVVPVAVTNIAFEQPPPGLPPAASCGAGWAHFWRLDASGGLHVWGHSSVTGTWSRPDAAAVSVASEHSGGADSVIYAATADGRLTAFASPGGTATDLGFSGAVKVVAGKNHVITLLGDGSVVSVAAPSGANDKGQAAVPPEVNGHARDIFAGGLWSAAILDDGTVAAWGDDTSGVVTALLGESIESAVSGSDANAVFVTVTRGGWQEAAIRAATTASIPLPQSFDPDVMRELFLRRFVDSADAVALAPSTSACGGYGIHIDPADAPYLWRMSMAVIGLRYHFRATSPAPNQVHFSVPALTAPGQDEIFSRIVFLRDTREVPVNPLATIGNWRALWNGQTPAGYTQLAAESFVHRQSVNSVFLPLSGPGHEGHVWVVIMPVHAPLAGDSAVWDIGQTGWEAERIFFWND